MSHILRLCSCLPFRHNSEQPSSESTSYDRLYKLTLILNYLNKKCCQFLCATKARQRMKVYVEDGYYKYFVLCGDMGFAYKVEIYSRQENDPNF